MRSIFLHVVAGAVSALAITAAMPVQAKQAQPEGKPRILSVPIDQAPIIVATPRQLIERGLCLSNQEMTARLRAEGQRSIVTGEAVMVDGVNVERPLGIVYSTNATGSRGYQLSGQRGPNNEPPATMCIDEVLTNIRLANPSFRRVPVSFYAPNGMSHDDALQQGGREGLRLSGALNHMMDNAAQNLGGFPIMQAQIVISPQNWQTITIINMPASDESTALHSRDRGYGTIRYVMSGSKQTAYAISLLHDGFFWRGR